MNQLKTSAASVACGLMLCLACLAPAGRADAATLRIVGGVPPSMMPVSQFLATGAFTTVDTFDIQSATPTLADLAGYDSVLVFTDNPPANRVALSDVLADYVDGGGMLVLGSYAFSGWFGISGGRLMTPGYAPLTNVGTGGDVSGLVVPVLPLDRLFDGVDPAQVRFFHNSNYAHPGLDATATLLATDGAGVNMIAKNAAGNIISMNMYPGYISNEYFTPQLYQLFANALLYNLHRDVTIDVKPGTFPNGINPRGRGVTPVAILTTPDFDAATVIPATVRFGATGTEAAPTHVALEDVDGDGGLDLILQFTTLETGIACGATSATLTGEAVGGLRITGSDSVQTDGCR